MLKLESPMRKRERKFRVLLVGTGSNGARASMSVDGTWKLETQTPTGMRKSKLILTAVGGTLTGEQSADGRSGPIVDGIVNGNAVAWKVSIVDPMRMTLEYSGTVRGNTMTGEMKAGRFGVWPFVARRH
jgi:hypothetical protein